MRSRIAARANTPLIAPAPVVEGRLTRMVGLTLEAVGCQAPIGDRCRIVSPGIAPFDAEVVGFDGDKMYLMPAERLHGVMPNARVIPLRDHELFSVGEHLLGRIVDGAGRPLDGAPLDAQGTAVALQGRSINPLRRPPISTPLDVGVRAINGLLTVGRGQRIGLFAGAGVGKSSLLGMMARHTEADVIVVGLIGERGREVVEFIENSLGKVARERAVVVAAPADDTPLMRLHGALLANSIAEYFRDQGKSVLLLMDSLTRFAQAQREIALAAGEMPATRGYPPSVFAQLPRLVERAGNTDNGGSITAFYTVLVEGDEVTDPVADAARAILDGHIVLSRELAESGHYPAIDLDASISRAMHAIVSDDHNRQAQAFRQAVATYNRNRDLIAVGAYQNGSDPLIDRAIALQPNLMSCLQQTMEQAVSFEASLEAVAAACVLQPAAPESESASAIAV
ncbi:MAG: flagellar protein export ATPase FliI [Pseudomonadota bacterium]